MKLAAKGSTNMADVDFRRSAELLHIVEKCAGHGPRLSAIANAAMTELTDLNENIKVAAQEAEKKAAAQRAEENAKIQAKLDADARAEEEAATRQPRIIPTFEGPKVAPRTGFVRPNDEKPDIRPNVYPGDSQTATIADRRV
jgi:hypothetical protein